MTCSALSLTEGVCHSSQPDYPCQCAATPHDVLVPIGKAKRLAPPRPGMAPYKKMLDRERQYYGVHVQEWTLEHAEQFVVIKNEDVLGCFGTIDEALAAGAARFGLTPFLVRRVGDSEQTVKVPALVLGLLRANS